MKHFFRFLTIIVIALTICVIDISCDKSNNDENNEHTDDKDNNSDYGEIIPDVQFLEIHGVWEAYGSTDENEIFGPEEDLELAISLYPGSKESGNGAFYHRYRYFDEYSNEYIDIKERYDLTYSYLDYFTDEHIYNFSVIIFGSQNIHESWYIKINAENSSLAELWRNWSPQDEVYHIYLRRVNN